jgi:hypothetical protein
MKPVVTFLEAVSKLLNGRGDGEITKRLNKVYSEQSCQLDAEFAAAQAKSLERENW